MSFGPGTQRRLMLAAAWICAGFTILSAIAYAGIFLGAMRSGRHVAH